MTGRQRHSDVDGQMAERERIAAGLWMPGELIPSLNVLLSLSWSNARSASLTDNTNAPVVSDHVWYELARVECWLAAHHSVVMKPAGTQMMGPRRAGSNWQALK